MTGLAGIACRPGREIVPRQGPLLSCTRVKVSIQNPSPLNSFDQLSAARQWISVVACCFVLGFVIVAARVWRFQFTDQPRLATAARSQHYRRIADRGRRGPILDRMGRLLANAVKVKSVFADPMLIDDFGKVAEALGNVLDLDPGHLLENLEARRDKRFVWVARRLSGESCLRLRKAMDGERGKGTFKGVGFQTEFRRHYVFGGLAGQVLGIVGVGNTPYGGIESVCQTDLRGQDGYRVAKTDVRGRRSLLSGLPLEKADDGAAIHLTLDAVIQRIVETELSKVVEEHRPKSAFAIVLEPCTGDILAMASEPGFDPNRINDYSPEELKSRTTCRPVMDAYELGSVFKPLVVAAAVSEGLVTMEQVFNCGHGAMKVGRRTIHDHHPYGDLSVIDILVKSSNVGIVKIAQMLGERRLHRYLTSLGFGKPTGIRFPAEAVGILRPLSGWTSYSLPSIALGHEISTSPLRVALAFSSLANGGVLMRPRLVKKVVESVGGEPVTRRVPVQPVGQVFRTSVVQGHIVPALCQVVERGTGRRAKVDGFAIAGKTGTAQKLLPDGRGFDHSAHIASFVAFGPADDPRVLVYLGVDESERDEYASKAAAPHVGNILRQVFEYLDLQPREEVAAK